MNSHFLSTSRSNPQFYIFSQYFEHATDHTGDVDVQLKPKWQEKTKQAAWLEFWQREGHELLELKWHKHYPQYKEDIEVATPEDRTAWEELWQQHAADQSTHFWHIFSCTFENYERDLINGLRGEDQILDVVGDDLTQLNIQPSDESVESTEEEEEHYLTANDDSDVLDEEQQLKLLGLPTSFGVHAARGQKKKRRSKPPPAYEADSDYDDMSKDEDAALHAVQSHSIQKKKKNKKKRTQRIPEFMQNDSGMRKYWFKRFSLFSLFDRGILLDRESWFSVTPEKVAKQTAHRLAGDIIVDAFCGCGGNAIQFAKTCSRVIAIDIDASKLAMAKHNAGIYGVAHNIEFVHADFLHFAASTSLRPDYVFLSPPWGGPQYQKQATFDIEANLLPLGASQLMQYARRLSDNIGVFLPRNSNMKQVIALSNVGQQCEVEHNYLDTRLVAITAYYGNLVASRQQEQGEDEQASEDKESLS